MVGNLRIVVVLSIVASAGNAHAGGARLVSGGPRGARGAVVTALDTLRAGPLAVCWVGTRSRAVRLQIGVAADGHVLGSRALSKGPVAQCAAGVMAVQRLPRSKAQYRMVVELPTSAPTGRTSDSIAASLAAHKPAIQACFDRAAHARDGEVDFQFLIQPDGRISYARVARSTIDDSNATSCMERSWTAFRLPPGGSKPIQYDLNMGLSHRAQHRQAKRAATGPRPQKDGPLAAAVLTNVMNAARPQFSKCEARAKGGPVSGVVTVRFTIYGNGLTRNVKVRATTLHNPAVEACLVATAKKLRFPAEKGRAKTRVFYPFSFQGR